MTKMYVSSPVKEFGLECWKAREALKISRESAVDLINRLAVKRESIADKKTLERVEKGVNFPKIGVVIAMAEVYGAPYLIEKRIEYERMDFAKKKRPPVREHRRT